MLTDPKLLAGLCLGLLLAVNLAVAAAVVMYRWWSAERTRNNDIVRRLRRARQMHEAQLLKYEDAYPRESELTYFSSVELHAAVDDLFGIHPDVVRDCYLPYDRRGRALGNAVIRAIGRLESLNPHHLHLTAVVDILRAIHNAQQNDRDRHFIPVGKIDFDAEGKMILPGASLN